MDKELVVYTRATACSDVDVTRRALRRLHIPYREIDIEADTAAALRLREWTGFLSVPTIILTEPGADEPYQTPAGIVPGQTPRNLDRGCLISEPDAENLHAFLEHNGLLRPVIDRQSGGLQG
jgi:glutaredoxin